MSISRFTLDLAPRRPESWLDARKNGGARSGRRDGFVLAAYLYKPRRLYRFASLHQSSVALDVYFVPSSDS
ncbi:hypothetical protein HBH98_202400 [Parastagonospora nodorum]|nr:hypothetical protein HBH98_202400 [Parastagonospora nodorum]KAH4358991.1 hypothetical protein HBH97_215300 [Parastagonospora nodorum]KAH4383158.1 hypothetical protein HBH99_187770 [Parastagonospora nodorum]KAH5029792.1 hypothetical protein HBI75_126610 [Parastagonospora nodorum]KAH5055769.1 hypothetical protein HBH96_124110 [Parastagonospora nodorum]